MTSPTIIPHVVLGHECQLSHSFGYVLFSIPTEATYDTYDLKAFVYFMTCMYEFQ